MASPSFTSPGFTLPGFASPIDLHVLRLDDARALLGHAGKSGSPEAGEAPVAYLQRLIDELCGLSLKDPLTGLGNRRHFLGALERAIESVARSGDSVLLLLLDIDYFKHINDVHGHLVGDQVLQAVACALADSIRPMDTVARYGGEEFAIILPNCSPACGRVVAERIRHGIEALSVRITPQTELRVTVSIGGAYAPQWVRSTVDLWVERADQQLYRAKADGRNLVFLDQPAESAVSAEEKGLLFSPLVPEEAAAAEISAAGLNGDHAIHPSTP